MPQIINSTSQSLKKVDIELSSENLKNLSGFAFNGGSGTTFNWDKVFIGTLSLTSAENDKIRVNARKYLKNNLISIDEYDKIVSDPKIENQRLYDYMKENPTKFFPIGDKVLIGAVQSGATKKGLIVINLAKLKSEVEISTGEKVKQSHKKTE